MFNNFLQYFRSEDDHDPVHIQLVRNLIWLVIAANILVMLIYSGLFGADFQNYPAFLALTVTLILEAITLVAAQRNNLLPAKLILPGALVAVVIVIASLADGARNVLLTAIPIIMVITEFLQGKRAYAVVFVPLTVISVVLLGIADYNGAIPLTPLGVDDLVLLAAVMIIGAGIINLVFIQMESKTLIARISEQKRAEENAELTKLRNELEERVNQRTAELLSANQISERRAQQFQAVAAVMSAISNTQNLDDLLPRITTLISQKFGVYHAGIFMFDRNREYAVLRAANSEGGQQMLANGHKLQIGQTGIVGAVAFTGKARIALDVGADAAYFNNPYLPETRSEIALPLEYGGQIIGVLDVQSAEPNAFGPDDVEALTTLADQVAIAINNSQAIAEAEKALREARSAIGESTKEAWQVMRPKSLGTGLQLTETAVKPLNSPIEGSHIREAMKQGQPVLIHENNETKFAIPIQVRGQTFGVIHLNRNGGAPLGKDDTDIAIAVANRLSLAIETATLIQATQHRAEVERVTTDITSRISSSTRFENILQTAAQELSRALGGEVLVQIEPVSMKMIMDT